MSLGVSFGVAVNSNVLQLGLVLVLVLMIG